MRLEKFTVQACCGKKSTIFKTDRPITLAIIASLVSLGFKESTHFTKAGILYVDNSIFIITGPIGSNRLQIKCKVAKCDQNLNDLEILLSQIK